MSVDMQVQIESVKRRATSGNITSESHKLNNTSEVLVSQNETIEEEEEYMNETSENKTPILGCCVYLFDLFWQIFLTLTSDKQTRIL